MKPAELLQLRLHHQQIVRPRHDKPGEVVRTLVAMQAQEYAMAKWAIALRMKGAARDDRLERAFNSGEILRTHVLRPTWHFVAPADIRWLLALTAPRVHAANAYMYRQLDLDAAVFRRSDVILERALRGGFRTRTSLQAILARSGIKAEGPRLGYVMMHAELRGLICSGPREGRQFTYALLDERAPAAKPFDRDAALAELSRRYFSSRGPANAQDFASWSGLTLKDARAGVESLGEEFEREDIDGKPHVFLPSRRAPRVEKNFAFLMPDYDEYGMSYKDRGALLPAPRQPAVALAYNRMIVVDGKIVGSWRRATKDKSRDIETQYVTSLNAAQLRAVDAAIERFASFSGSDSDP